MHAFSALTPTTFLERSGIAFTNDVAVKHANVSVTFGELLLRTRKLTELLMSFGVEPGNRVGLLSENNLQVIESHFAIPASGAVIVNLNPWLKSNEIRKQIEYCGIQLVIADETCLERHKEVLLSGRVVTTVVVIPGKFASQNKYSKTTTIFGGNQCVGGVSVVNYERTILEHYGRLHLDSLIQSEMDPIAINFTSGTTGNPKGVMISHRAAYLHAIGQVLMIGLQRSSNYLWLLPMFHVNGWGHMWANIVIGAAQVLPETPLSNGDEIIEQLQRHLITHTAGAPRLIRQIVSEHNETVKINDLTVVTGGAAPTPSLVKQMEDNNIKLIHQYGLNETCGPYVVCEEQDKWHVIKQEERIGKKLRQGVATIHAGTGLRVVDSKMKDVPHDGVTLGEIVMSGNTVALGYYSNDSDTEKSFFDGWFHSGDMAVVHSDGYIEIKDRIKDLIYVETDYGWENISSIEIENIISKHPGASDVAVIGLSFDSLAGNGPYIFAFVEQARDSFLSDAELQGFCEDKLPYFKRPDFFLFTNLPKTATGKIKKNVLTERATEYIRNYMNEKDCHNKVDKYKRTVVELD